MVEVLLFLWTKKETVIGIIGNTQGVKIAKNPAKKHKTIKLNKDEWILLKEESSNKVWL